MPKTNKQKVNISGECCTFCKGSQPVFNLLEHGVVEEESLLQHGFLHKHFHTLVLVGGLRRGDSTPVISHSLTFCHHRQIYNNIGFLYYIASIEKDRVISIKNY